jgi:branched-chain amino acid transport system permease protein
MLYRENGQFKTNYRADQQIFPIVQDRWFIWILIAIAFIAVPLMLGGNPTGDYILRALVIPFLILSLAALGLNLLVGYCGQISLGSAAFMAIGAYSAYNFMLRVPGMNLVAAFILAGMVTMVAGVLFGFPSLRIKGLYLAVATLAAQFFCDWFFSRNKWVTNDSSSGSVSVANLELFGFAIDTPARRYVFVLAFVVVCAFAAKNLVRGHIGRSWMAIRDMDVAAAVIGIRPMQAKLTAFAMSSFFIGIAGAMWGFVHLGSWEPAAFDVNRSLNLLFMIIIGGLGSIMGSFFGAAFIVTMPILISQAPAWLGIPISTAMASHLEAMIFGGLIVFFLIVEPHGLAKLWSIGKQKLRLWPFPH